MRNNRQLTKPGIQTAIERVYTENKYGLIIPRHRLAWKAWAYAVAIDASEKRAYHVAKYEGERKELVQLRLMKMKYKNIKRSNIHDLIIDHMPYWIVISTILVGVYFLG